MFETVRAVIKALCNLTVFALSMSLVFICNPSFIFKLIKKAKNKQMGDKFESFKSVLAAENIFASSLFTLVKSVFISNLKIGSPTPNVSLYDPKSDDNASRVSLVDIVKSCPHDFLVLNFGSYT